MSLVLTSAGMLSLIRKGHVSCMGMRVCAGAVFKAALPINIDLNDIDIANAAVCV